MGNEPDPFSNPSAPPSRETFIFLDRQGKRWPRFKRLLFTGSLLFFIGAILFIQTLVLPSHLTTPMAVEQSQSGIKALQGKKIPHALPQASKPLWLDFVKKHKEPKGDMADATPHHRPVTVPEKKEPVVIPPGTSREIRLGMYESWDPDSFDSLKEHLDQLTHLCPDWLVFDSEIGKLKVTQEKRILEMVEEQGVVLLPMLRNLAEGDTWMPEAVEGLVNGPAGRQDQFIVQLVDALTAMGAGGVVLDWQQIDPSYRNNMSAFLARIAGALHQERMELWLCVSTDRDMKIFDLDALATHIDRFVAMLHDEHAEFDQAGPIASREFFTGWLTTLIDGYGKPSQWVVSLGSYGYDWAEGAAAAEHISFEDVMSRAGRSGQTPFGFHHPSFNPHFDYGAGDKVHTIWFLDAVTFLNQLMQVRGQHVGGIAVNRLGTEDPAIWDVLTFPAGHPPQREELARLEVIRPGNDIAHIGKGNLITMIDERREGLRRLHLDKKNAPGTIFSATYEKFPSYLTILHQGQGPEDGVTITFDDGPDSDWTPQILDILKAHNIRATFFMIGANMEKHPRIVKRILAEGHMIGVHTYNHPNVALISEERAHIELNATQRLIESLTGHSTILFRPPYNADTNPHEVEELVPVKLAQEMGYVTVTEDIDPEDWDEPGVDTMLERIKRGRQRGGNVVLLHDAGGDRSQTIAVLPQVIKYLEARGDRILSLPDLLGISAEELMPPLPLHQKSFSRWISESGFITMYELTNFFWAFMIVATGLTVFKTLTVSWLAFRSRRLDQEPDEPFCPPVSVLIAAYNEEKVIRDTLRSVLNTTYPGPVEVVVVDDGSKDSTSAIVAAMAEDDPRIRLIRQVNLGKATALRNGLQAIRHEFMVSLDADTQFTPETIGHLLQPFADPAVGAVSGRARVGNPKTLMAKFQSLEYTCGFNLDRRAYHLLHCITVVPGAVSALRVRAVQESGGISTDTLAEDTDLTLAMHKHGFAIHYASRAIAWTEAPETVRAFAKQRFRWSFGTLQCLWKHRELLFNTHYPALGWFSLPCTWFFNIILVALGSIIDLLLILSLILSPANSILYWYFVIFLISDLVLAAVACLVEREPLSQVWLVLPMRFIYRPVLNIVVAQAILRALKGVWVGWGKLDRTASVPYNA